MARATGLRESERWDISRKSSHAEVDEEMCFREEQTSPGKHETTEMDVKNEGGTGRARTTGPSILKKTGM